MPTTSTPLAVNGGVLAACQIALAPLTVPVYDHVPQQRAYPFVSIDLQQVLANDGAETQGFIHNCYLSVWSEYRGQKEVWTILDALWRGLHDNNLRLETGILVLCQVTEQRCDLDADGLTYQGNLTLRIHTNPLGNL